MVICSACGRTMEKVPDWMQSIQVQFVCNNCPNRELTNIAFVNLDSGLTTNAKLDEDEETEELTEEEEEVEPEAEEPAIEAEEAPKKGAKKKKA